MHILRTNLLIFLSAFVKRIGSLHISMLAKNCRGEFIFVLVSKMMIVSALFLTYGHQKLFHFCLYL